MNYCATLQEFDIPTSDSCIDKDDPITTTVNQEYMKKKTYDPTNLQKQVQKLYNIDNVEFSDFLMNFIRVLYDPSQF